MSKNQFLRGKKEGETCGGPNEECADGLVCKYPEFVFIGTGICLTPEGISSFISISTVTKTLQLDVLTQYDA